MMGINKSKILWLAVIVFLLGTVYLRSEITTTGTGQEQPQAVISLGEDLTPQQKEAVMKYFQAWEKGKSLRYITVSNQEERIYLEGVVDEELIGSRAISSVYCELLDKGKGIEVQTENITHITPFMYANALVTAGIEDARVVVAAPFDVSGTAALTGIIKAFETASGENLKEENKATAYEEMAETSELGDRIGQDNAEKFIFEVKKKVVAEDISDPDEIRKIIMEISADLNIKLSEQDISKVVVLMQKIQQLNISAGQLGNQMQNLERKLDELQNSGKEAVGLLKQILAALEDLITMIKSLVGA